MVGIFWWRMWTTQKWQQSRIFDSISCKDGFSVSTMRLVIDYVVLACYLRRTSSILIIDRYWYWWISVICTMLLGNVYNFHHCLSTAGSCSQLMAFVFWLINRQFGISFVSLIDTPQGVWNIVIIVMHRKIQSTNIINLQTNLSLKFATIFVFINDFSTNQMPFWMVLVLLCDFSVLTWTIIVYRTFYELLLTSCNMFIFWNDECIMNMVEF